MKLAIYVANSLKKDPRVIKQVLCARDAGHEVLFVGCQDAFLDYGFLDELHISYRIADLGAGYVGHLASPFKKIRRKILMRLRPYRALCAFRPDVIHANDFNTLIWAYLAAKRTGARLIYDSHEVWAENSDIVCSRSKHAFCLWAERRLVRRVDCMISVSHAAAHYFATLYHIPEPTVITNCPMKSTLPPQSRDTDRFDILYHGLMIAGRGYEEFVRSAKYLPEDVSLCLRGYGSIVPTLHRIVEEEGLEDRVTFAQPVEVAELISYAAKSDVGIVITKPVNLNFKLSISNKVFEYAHAGLPVILSDVPEHRFLNDRYHFAIVLDEVTPEKIAEAILLLKNDRPLYEKLRKNARRMAQQMCWENESVRLLGIYDTLYGQKRSATQVGRKLEIGTKQENVRGKQGNGTKQENVRGKQGNGTK